MDKIRASLLALLQDFHSDDTSAWASFTFSADFAGFEGHFPGNPILPAVVQVQMACLVAAAATEHGGAGTLGGMDNAKFTRPVGPGDTVLVQCTADPKKNGEFRALLTRQGESVASFTFRLAGTPMTGVTTSCE